VDRRAAFFALAWLLAGVLTVPVQLASIVAFDATGLDGAVPDPVFVVVVPALVLAGVPTGVARRVYGRRVAGVTAVVAIALLVLVTAYTMQFYGMCGPGC
jgi:hypothetical protein